MSTLESASYETVLSIVYRWTPDKRFALVQNVLSTLAPVQPKRKTFDKALGLLATDQPPPTDAEIEQWLDEHRMEKYT